MREMLFIRLSHGDPVAVHGAPERIVKRAQERLRETTGLTLEAMGELEYYVLSDAQDLYQIPNQKGYHASAPFSKWEQMRFEAMRIIARTVGKIKYSHIEVGHFRDGNVELEQQEIEFIPTSIEEAADRFAFLVQELKVKLPDGF